MLDSLLLKSSNHYLEEDQLYFLVQDQTFIYQLIFYKAQVSTKKVYLLVYHNEFNTIWLAFYNQHERTLFRELLKIPGIGLKNAQLLVKSYTYQEILMIVKTNNEAKLLELKGIGTKMAKNVITKLQKTLFNVTYSLREEELISCLTRLGYSRIKVLNVIKNLDLTRNDEECLQFLLTWLGGEVNESR
ncbi:helix-hairpin-helix domain-containing protein [Mesoplasma whartonense]|uniref:helix-hairpin-helix domain-containing protein n=1 Tax=Mesoplasma whartonense TaxID=2878854 RepID=UPI002022A459|nr:MULTISPECIES: helix-hairpin-helix domain-containing protein [unclassified Mesoplasma]MCL8212911.1 Holliday junction ATP-dependent DNA helicase RuvA [Mesoplasma sp. JKS002661]MCL8216110.1 Holliday junction ATP-dependent DNA helicase RuvA [Mesoplasma sp. JKS002657]